VCVFVGVSLKSGGVGVRDVCVLLTKSSKVGKHKGACTVQARVSVANKKEKIRRERQLEQQREITHNIL